MILKSSFSAVAIAGLLIFSTQTAKADDDGWQGPSVIFSFGGQPDYPPPPPPPVYYQPPPAYYTPPPAYAAPPGYYANPGYVRWHSHEDDDEGDDD